MSALFMDNFELWIIADPMAVMAAEKIVISLGGKWA